MLNKIVDRIVCLIGPSKALSKFVLQVNQCREAQGTPKIRKNVSDFVIWFPNGLQATMCRRAGVIVVGYHGLGVYHDEPAADQARAKRLFSKVMEQKSTVG